MLRSLVGSEMCIRDRGDTITTSAEVQKVLEIPDGREIRHIVTIKRQTGEVAISGTASVIT